MKKIVFRGTMKVLTCRVLRPSPWAARIPSSVGDTRWPHC